jgi:phosphoenolpyruvate---glycerone phosphotransferase subunit DhaK
MQKIINQPDRFVDEMLQGVLLAHGNRLRAVTPRAIVRADAPVSGKVGIATGGGSGHLPVFLGYVGYGFADGAAVGEIFASPSAEAMLQVTRAVDAGSGVLHVYGNYTGDGMNFSLAAELAAAEGIEVATIVAADDVASAPPDQAHDRRGIGGIFFLYKIAGARGEAGGTLEQVCDVTRRAASNLRSMGVALSPCIVPSAGRATFELDEGEMEIGMGIHGEPGIRRGPLVPADEIADALVSALLKDLPYSSGEQAAVLVNGLGATPIEELYVLYRRVHALLDAAGIRVARVFVGEYATSLEMAGASVSLLKLDEELLNLLDAPGATPFLAR